MYGRGGKLLYSASDYPFFSGSLYLFFVLTLPVGDCSGPTDMAELVPQSDNIEEVYCDPSTGERPEDEVRTRWVTLLKYFEKTYGTKPDYVARSPGRVNIIGEHIDYSLYNVLPTAVTVDALVAVKVKNSSTGALNLKIANFNPDKYPTRTFSLPLEKEIDIDATKHEWTNYFLAGLRGAWQYLKEKKGPSFVPKDMDIVMDGNVPAGGGLSSSAALVCAAALSVMKANSYNVSKEDLLDLAIVSERAVGVYSGGMDQAASIFSKRGYLLYCTFFPTFGAEHVPVPKPDPEITFLIAQSFVTSDKHVTAPRCYNLRVVECTLASVVLAKIYDITLDPDKSPLGFSLRNFQQEFMRRQGKLELPFEEQLDLVAQIADEKLSQEDGYTRDEISQILGISVGSLEQEYMSKFPVQAERFKLRQRALHVLHEARRVITFKGILSDAERGGQGLKDDKIRQLGDLMNETQNSCRDVYECSCPELDEICGIVRKAGAYGSRLTGAGWGGCTVHMVPQTKVQAVTEALKTEYYFKHFPDITEEKLQHAIVISKPSQGSFVISGKALDV